MMGHEADTLTRFSWRSGLCGHARIGLTALAPPVRWLASPQPQL